MPHDATPRNGRMHKFGLPGWMVALAVAIAFSAAAAVVAVTTGAFLILLPALGIVAIGYGIYAALAARRRARYVFGLPRRLGVIQDGRALRRRSRLTPP